MLLDTGNFAVGDGQVFMIDSTISQQQRDSLLREDKTELKNLPPEEAKKKEAELKDLDIRLAVALDAESGQQQWAVPVDVTDCSYVGIGGGQGSGKSTFLDALSFCLFGFYL